MAGLIPVGTRNVKAVAKIMLPAPARNWITAYRRNRLDRQLFRGHLRPTDVFIVAHPKSGNTWLAYMLAILIHKDAEGRITLANIGDYVPTEHGRDSAIADHAYLPDPRIFRNETPRYPHLYPRIVYLIRDPRAVLVSLFHMYNTIFAKRRMTLEDFLSEYLTHGCIRQWEPLVTRWDRQVLDWMRRADHDERVMIVRYEEMVADRRLVLERVARFAGIPYGEGDLALAVSRGSFDSMRRNEEEHGAESYSPEAGKRGRFIRRGQVDGWKSELEPHLVERIEHELAAAMKIAGYL